MPHIRSTMTMMTALFFTAPALATSVAPAHEEAAQPALEIEGMAALVSQYRFRGISLSDEQVALQADLRVTHASGAYAGAWASSLDGFGELGGANLEVDLYGGYKVPLGRGATLDAGVTYYAYPGSSGGDFEFFEPYANVSGAIGPMTAKLGIAFAPRQDALEHHSNLYVFSDLASSIPKTPITLKGHVGFSKGDTPLSPSGDYVDWSLGADARWRQLTLGVAYVDTNLNAAEAALGHATKDIVDEAIVVSLTAAF